jgi:DtxR family Mn-dependent transcriptional regulator
MPEWLLILSVVLLGLWLFWPRLGLIDRWRQMRELAARVLREDTLKHIHKAQVNGRRPTLNSIAGILHLHADRAAGLLGDMEKRGLLTFSSGEIQLTAAGREAALHIIRAHRLWESYLADRTGVAESEWHDLAEDREHHLAPDQVNALSAQLGHPTHDPHGDAIPAAGSALAADAGQSLNTVAPGETVRITHVEDEPAVIYAQLAAEGLRPGMKVRVLERSPQSIRFWADGDEHVLAPMLANNLGVVPIPAFEIEEEPELLSNLRPGEKARVLELSRACRGAERRRLMDLGFVPGTEVGVEMVSPSGDPTAYRVRGTVIALRREQAALVRVTALNPAAA